MIAADTFLYPQFMGDTEGREQAEPPPLAFEDGKVVIIGHDETMDHATSRLSITALGLDGTRRWTTTLDHCEVRAGWIVDRRLVLAASAGDQGFVTALDESDGHIVWRAGTWGSLGRARCAHVFTLRVPWSPRESCGSLALPHLRAA